MQSQLYDEKKNVIEPNTYNNYHYNYIIQLLIIIKLSILLNLLTFQVLHNNMTMNGNNRRDPMRSLYHQGTPVAMNLIAFDSDLHSFSKFH